MNPAKILSRLVQIGTVTNVDNVRRMARVKFHDTGITSAWLHVLKSPPFIPACDGPQHTEFESGGNGDNSFASHRHDLVILPWMPKVNDTVLTIYLPVKEGDGYIIGGV